MRNLDGTIPSSSGRKSRKGTGNRCGHDPKQPRLQLASPIPVGAGAPPRILSLASERVESLYKFPRLLPLARVSKRKIRTERLEAIVLVLKALFKKVSLANLQCGRPTLDNGFIHIGMTTIMTETGMGRRRCERAIRELLEANLIKVEQPRRKDEHGMYYGLNAERELTDVLFAWLGLDQMLAKEKKKAVERITKWAAGHQKSFQAVTKRILPKVMRQKGKNSSSQPWAGYKRPLVDPMVWTQRSSELMQKHPNIPGQEIRALVNRQFGLPEDYSPGGQQPIPLPIQ